MKGLMIFAAFVALSLASPVPLGVSEDGRFLTYYDDNGNLVMEDLTAPVTPYAIKMENLHFMLYTTENRDTPFELTYNDVANLQNSPYDSSRPTKFLIHGWQGSYEGDTMQGVKDAFLSTGIDVNVIMCDYKKYNSPYVSAVSNAKTIGQEFANFAEYLIVNGLRHKDIHIIGHSLGAHVSGFTANNIKSGTVPRITAMDPAGPLFGNKKDEDKLSSQDATFVDVIHTSAVWGMEKPTGTADFYPNGGENQPSCFLQKGGICDHIVACEYYARSLIEPTAFPARKCISVSDAQASDKNKCEPSGAYMGEPALATCEPGIYYVAT